MIIEMPLLASQFRKCETQLQFPAHTDLTPSIGPTAEYTAFTHQPKEQKYHYPIPKLP